MLDFRYLAVHLPTRSAGGTYTRDMALEQIETEALVREAHSQAIRAISRANSSWARAGELCQLDIDLLARSRDLIDRGRQRLKRPSADG